MTERDIQEHLMIIYDSLSVLSKAVKILLEDDAREPQGIFKDMDEDVHKFFEGTMKHGKTVE